MVCIDFEYGSNLLFTGVYEYGGITKLIGHANAIDGIPLGHINRTKAVKNILGHIDCIHTGNIWFFANRCESKRSDNFMYSDFLDFRFCFFRLWCL